MIEKVKKYSNFTIITSSVRQVIVIKSKLFYSNMEVLYDSVNSSYSAEETPGWRKRSSYVLVNKKKLAIYHSLPHL